MLDKLQIIRNCPRLPKLPDLTNYYSKHCQSTQIKVICPISPTTQCRLSAQASAKCRDPGQDISDLARGVIKGRRVCRAVAFIALQITRRQNVSILSFVSSQDASKCGICTFSFMMLIGDVLVKTTHSHLIYPSRSVIT